MKELVRHHMQFKDVRHMRTSTLKKMMQRPTFIKELELHRIDCSSSHGDLEHWEFLKQQLDTMTPEQINPPSLLSGHDLMKLGVLPGRQMGRILDAVKPRSSRATCRRATRRSPSRASSPRRGWIPANCRRRPRGPPEPPPA